MRTLLLATSLAALLLALAWRYRSADQNTPAGIKNTTVQQTVRREAQETASGKTRTIPFNPEAPSSEWAHESPAMEEGLLFVFLDKYSDKRVAGVSLHAIDDARTSEGGIQNWAPQSSAKWTGGKNGEILLRSHELPPIAFEVHAPGFGPAWISGREVGGPQDRTVNVQLSPSSVWSGVVKDLPPRIPASLAVHATVTAQELQAIWTPVRHLEFERLHWRSEVAHDGSFSISGLPSEVRLDCWVECWGKRLHDLESVMRLSPGEIRSTVWHFPQASAVIGHYRDLDGHPVVNAEIWAMTPWIGHANSRYFRGKKQLASTRTDTNGRFEFDTLHARTVVITPADEHMLEGLWPVAVQLPTKESVLLQPLAKGWIEGRVLSSRGPIANARVYHDKEESVTCDPSGSFKIPVYGDQEVFLTASAPPASKLGLLCRERVFAKSGDRGVLIRLEQPCSFQVTASSGLDEGTPVWFTQFSCPDLTDPRWVRSATAMWKSAGLRPGRYVFWAETENNLVAISRVHSVNWGDPKTKIELNPALGVEVLLRGPIGKPWPGIKILRDGVPIGSKQLSIQASNFWLPPGSYEFRFVSDDHELTLSPSRAQLRIGNPVTIQMQ